MSTKCGTCLDFLFVLSLRFVSSDRCVCFPRAGSISGANAGSVLGGTTAEDVCECNTGRYDTYLGVCGESPPLRSTLPVSEAFCFRPGLLGDD